MCPRVCVFARSMTISKTDIELTSEQYALVGALWEALVASWRTAVLCYESALKQLQQDKPLPDVYGSSQFANLRCVRMHCPSAVHSIVGQHYTAPHCAELYLVSCTCVCARAGCSC